MVEEVGGGPLPSSFLIRTSSFSVAIHLGATMSHMRRNCLIASIAWPVLVGIYLAILTRFPVPNHVIVALVMATIMWVALVITTGSRFTYRDWRARRALARGERPRDGDLVAAVGTIRPVFEPLRSPMSGEECILYSYEIGPHPVDDAPTTKDYVGYGATRAAVHTPYAQFLLGTFPVLEHVPKRLVRETGKAAEYIAGTALEEVSIADLTRGIFAIHREPLPMKKDFKFGEPQVDVADALVQETLIAPGDAVTVLGKYVSATNSIVSDTSEKGFMRLRRGGDARSVPSVPWNAIGQLVGGLAVIVAANAVLWFFITAAPR